MKQYTFLAVALSFFGCESSSPAPPPEPDHLAADIAKLNADLLLCMQRENDRLRADRDALDSKIAAAKKEALELLVSAPQRKSKRQP